MQSFICNRGMYTELKFEDIESLKDKRTYHNFYTFQIKERLEADKILVDQIKKEINRK